MFLEDTIHLMTGASQVPMSGLLIRVTYSRKLKTDDALMHPAFSNLSGTNEGNKLSPGISTLQIRDDPPD